MKNAICLIFFVIILLLNSCGKQAPEKDIDAITAANQLNFSASMKAPFPSRFEIKIDGDSYYDSCSPDRSDQARVQARMNAGVIQMIYNDFKGLDRVDVTIIDRGAFCSVFTPRIQKNDVIVIKTIEGTSIKYSIQIKE